jgi:hypothetical protein
MHTAETEDYELVVAVDCRIADGTVRRPDVSVGELFVHSKAGIRLLGPGNG